MKTGITRKIAILGMSLMGMALFGGETVETPQISWEPFEPPASAFYNQRDKFAHPPEIIPPTFLWPFELRRSIILGETITLVQIGRDGCPRRIAVLSSTDKLFTRSTILALEKARWTAGVGDVWFYYRTVFDPEKMLK